MAKQRHGIDSMHIAAPVTWGLCCGGCLELRMKLHKHTCDVALTILVHLRVSGCLQVALWSLHVAVCLSQGIGGHILHLHSWGERFGRLAGCHLSAFPGAGSVGPLLACLVAWVVGWLTLHCRAVLNCRSLWRTDQGVTLGFCSLGTIQDPGLVG